MHCGAARLALRATASPSCPPASRVVEPVGALIKSPPVPRYAKRPPCGGPFAYLAERGGFEPPKRGLDAYTLSRRAPSTTRTPLRNLRVVVTACRAGDSSARAGLPQARGG